MSDDAEDDDEVESEEPEPEPVARSPRRNNKPKGKNKGGGGYIDLASNPSILTRYASNAIVRYGRVLGKKLGTDVPWVNAALKLAVDHLGKALTGEVLTFAGALIQVPKFVKSAARVAGVPEVVNALGDEFLDSSFAGLELAIEGDRFNQREADRSFKDAFTVFEKGIGAFRSNSFPEAFMLLDPYDQANMNAILTALALPEKAELRKQFDAYRPKLASVVAQKTLLRCVIKVPAGSPAGTPPSFTTVEVVAYLKRTYGEIKPAGSIVTDAFSNLTSGIKAVDEAVRKHIGPPPAGQPDPMLEALEDYTKDVQARRRRRIV